MRMANAPAEVPGLTCLINAEYRQTIADHKVSELYRHLVEKNIAHRTRGFTLFRPSAIMTTTIFFQALLPHILLFFRLPSS